LLRNTTFKKRKFSHLRKLQQAGGKLHKTLIEEIIGYESGCDLYVMYGQTEATARLSCLPPTLTREKIGSIGNGIQGVKLQVLDDFGNTVLPGQTGEIIATGENISPGYYKDQEATLEKFKNGFLQTGDIATVDSDGYIYIVGRKSDFIKSYGNRVSSQEIESATLEINDIFYAAVIGIPDLERGEAIVLFVTLKHNSTITNQDIIIHLKSRFPMYKVPAKVYVIDGMPFNSNGKIDKTELCKKLEAESNQSE
jgi:acyl-CoA synthetase (AMP-forming)/AMP-acid ligase II